MVQTFEVSVDGRVVGEVVEVRCGGFSRDSYRMWRANPLVSGVFGGQFNSAAAAEAHLTAQAKLLSERAARTQVASAWPEPSDHVVDVSDEEIPF